MPVALLMFYKFRSSRIFFISYFKAYLFSVLSEQALKKKGMLNKKKKNIFVWK